ncbi:MAG TPA: MBL fold metallo-hydrolase [Candidatus Acidoferrum sp.]|nr:MBL fold metallo-hydrolase [Candidatus Acidoferrum sp.]
MKITKYVHSCLIIEDQGRVGVIDPGMFSVGSGFADPGVLRRLDDIIITHEHPDHLDITMLRQLLARFPQARVYGDQTTAIKLKTLGVNVITASQPGVELFACSHEPTEPLGATPLNVGVHYLDRLTDPGDSHHFTESKEILALPVTAPWGTVMRAAEVALEVKPTYILPVHDWHWNSAARRQMYERLETFFGEHGITFIKAIDGQAIEL